MLNEFIHDDKYDTVSVLRASCSSCYLLNVLNMCRL